jgi:hypothetical protein
MIIAQRTLEIRQLGKAHSYVEVKLFAPVQRGADWSCRYEIDWPEGQQAMDIYGFDSMQAVILALQVIGSDLYASKAHGDRTLVFEKPGSGYGFPIAGVLRKALIGDDKKFFG